LQLNLGIDSGLCDMAPPAACWVVLMIYAALPQFRMALTIPSCDARAAIRAVGRKEVSTVTDDRLLGRMTGIDAATARARA
jgi:hypothetical protein